MRSCIVYASVHHGNTERLVRAMGDAIGADLFNVLDEEPVDLAAYDLVGLASGIYFGTFHKRMLAFARNIPLMDVSHVFLAATCGARYRDHTRGMKRILRERGVRCAGSFQRPGYDTYGIFGKIGGIAKGRPNERDLAAAATFARSMVEQG